MRKIGILGGVGPQASAQIYKSIIDQAIKHYEASDNEDYPYVVLASVPVPDFISDKENIPKAKAMLVEAAKGLVNSGCERLCIGSNTVHILLEEIENEVKTPFLSMVDLVVQECSNRKYSKVALLGTPVLIESGIYNKKMQAQGIELLTPDEKQEKVCDQVIRHIIAGEEIGDVREDYVAVLSAMFDAGAEAIILGCTELPMVLNYEALGKRVLRSDDILAKGIVDYFYS